MPSSVSHKIEKGYQHLNEGKIEEALQLVVEIENGQSLTPDENLQNQLLKGAALTYMGRIEEAFKIGEQASQESKILNKPTQSFDAVFLKFGTLLILGRVSESWEDVKFCENLLKTNYEWIPSELEQCKATFSYMNGYFHYLNGEYDLAINYLIKSLAFIENSYKYSFMVPSLLTIIGDVYLRKGELESALQSHKKVLKLSKGGSFLFKILSATSQYFLGVIYYQQGKSDLAIENCEESLKTFETYGIPFFIGAVYYLIIIIYLDQKDCEQARKLLSRLRHIYDKTQNKIVYDTYYYELSRARILKSSTRTRDRAKAEIILKNLIDRNVDLKTSLNLTLLGEIPYAIIMLCELYFQELKFTNDMKILEDIEPLIERIISEAERSKSSHQLAKAYLLWGKTALLRMNMGEARRYLTEAQNIAEPKGLQLLAKSISRNHDKLLDQLDEWENLKKKKASLSERMDLALVDETIDQIQGKRTIDDLELKDEDSVLLMILAEGGSLIFSYPFAKEWEKDEELLGSFLSAFASFSDEFFSQDLDRAKFGKFTVLMKSTFNFTICYLFKGQSYLALKKLVKFVRIINENDSIIETFQKFQNRSQLLEIKDYPFLKSFITEVFVKNE
ncbi:MAG: hypothetical protein KJI71_04630 [Patescibacteria group bacterium]|nr:hypothetical protein [Patescibacteria group bacterium]